MKFLNIFLQLSFFGLTEESWMNHHKALEYALKERFQLENFLAKKKLIYAFMKVIAVIKMFFVIYLKMNRSRPD